MHRSQRTYRRIIDVGMCIILLLQMAYQVMGEAAHEWLGISMTILVILHQVLNRRFYGALSKGKYTAYRTALTLVNILLLISFALTALCGMCMSNYAVPFLYGVLPMSFVRVTHLSMSHWSFVLMGLHLGLHMPTMLSGYKPSEGIKHALLAICTAIAGLGLWLFLRTGMPLYMLFRVFFAYLDYDKAGILVLLENVTMLLFWVFIGCQGALLLRKDRQGNPLLPLVRMLLAILLGLVLNMFYPGDYDDLLDTTSWNMEEAATWEAEATTEETKAEEPAEEEAAATEEKEEDDNDEAISEAQEETPLGSSEAATTDAASVEDGFILLPAGTFMMGSPESENWRIDDETQHEVTVSSFYVDAYETTQAEWEALMGTNPSTFKGERLPVENISWLDAILYANAKSTAEGLNPVYEIDNDAVTWDRSLNGYRLPTEAEWEYACRAGITTPFNLERSLDADDANFYGHYPYEIEENYFNDSVLEARPGQYRGTTVEVGSFEMSPWGLYDMHGNVNEWCWDWYGPYDVEDTDNPIGPDSGTRHVYRGGGWNDFGKNMRSAYRAAGQSDLKSYNLGLRLVRNAASDYSGSAMATGGIPTTTEGSKVLIAFFSWGGNTRGIAHEIQRQTGYDIFEIEPIPAYSDDYNTVLMEAQRDQHNQARPEIEGHVDNMDTYDTILLGYPNWWASIPMPIASFLEEYDFTGKRIIPFCSHGGGRFGQSLTAIAKLASASNIGTGLSVHYSGGSSLPSDIAAWLEGNGLTGP